MNKENSFPQSILPEASTLSTSSKEAPSVPEQYRQQAVALSYESAIGSPRVIAKGKGVIAEEIIRRAKDAGIYVHASKELVSLLMLVNIDSEIPPSLYMAIAELLAWIYKNDTEAAKKMDLKNKTYPSNETAVQGAVQVTDKP